MAVNITVSTRDTLSPGYDETTPTFEPRSSAFARRSHRHTLSASLSSLAASSSSANHHGTSGGSSSHITKSYRQASTLFLTRRLPEALSTVLPLVTPGDASRDEEGCELSEPAPVARTSRNTRVKVWSLYLTILNAVVELNAEEGKRSFGSQEWHTLWTKVRDGAIWEEVVRNGYYGVEADVDIDVAVNLATLLLAHSPTQVLNQRRLETYLAARVQAPTCDVTMRMAQNPRSGPRMVAQRYSSPARNGLGGGGIDTPRDLNALIKLLEIFTLHVLVRNSEWEYAREFISASPFLDEERRDAFLQALQSLKDDQEGALEKDDEAGRKRHAEEQLTEERETAAAAAEHRERKRLETERQTREREVRQKHEDVQQQQQQQQKQREVSLTRSRSKQFNSAKAAGRSSRSGSRSSRRKPIPDQYQQHPQARSSSRPPSSSSAQDTGKRAKNAAQPGSKPGSKAVVAKSNSRNNKGKSGTISSSNKSTGSHTNNNNKNKNKNKNNNNHGKAWLSPSSGAALVFSSIGAQLELLGAMLRTHPMRALRFLGFLLGFLLVFGRRDVRERIARMVAGSWQKVLTTAAMGLKVSHV